MMANCEKLSRQDGLQNASCIGSQEALQFGAGFYKGRIAAAIVDVLRRERGVMTAEDLAHHRSVTTRPIHTSYRGYTIYEVPPPTQVLTY